MTAVVAAGGWYQLGADRGSDLSGPAPASPLMEAAATETTGGDGPLSLSVVRPQSGGLTRRMVQTGSVVAYETAALHAKVSGYVKALPVDIGTEVTEGQVLLEIESPELAKEVERNAALLEQSRGQVRQAEARLRTAQAQEHAAVAAVEQAEAAIERWAAERELRQKEHARIKQLVDQQAIMGKLVDEKLHQLEAAAAAERQAQAAARAAQADLAVAGAQVEVAQADLSESRAAVRVAAVAVEQAHILADYTRIVAPYSGVITQRNYDRGDFVRSAAQGGAGSPLLVMARTDQVRVIVPVPDRLVPFVNPGDLAEVRIDALAGQTFSAQVSRIAHRQDRKTRTMRAEIDLPNPDGRLRDGMYGAVTVLSPAPSHGLTLPASCLLSGTQNGQGMVYVVRDGQVVRTPVWVGATEAEMVEVLAGLQLEDDVVLAGHNNVSHGEVAKPVRKSEVEESLARKHSG